MSEKKVLTIVGRGDSWIYCPFEGDIWIVHSVLTLPGMDERHIDKMFAFDDISCQKTHSGKALKDLIDIATERKIPIVSTRGYATERYPLLKILDEFGVSWFRLTVSYMLALAIYEKYDMVHIYGIDQDKEDRYIRTRPFVDFWLGVMVGRGIKYTIASMNFARPLPSRMMNTIDKALTPEDINRWKDVKEWKGEESEES